MGRIDEALKRAESSGQPQGDAEERQQLFEGAWSLVDATKPTRQALRPAAAPQILANSAEDRASGDAALLSLSSRWRERVASGDDSDPGMVEQFRRLAGVLHHAQQASGLRSVMVTSASPDDGKTLTSINLALVLAESYRANVLLIDADLRRPSIPNVVEMGGQGLSEALRSPTEQPLTLLPISPKLTLLPAGQPIANSIEALTSPRMRQILEEATERYDWVILDAPPVGPTADARLLTDLVGTTLFVIHAGKTQCPQVQKAVSTIGRERILGVVLNGMKGLSNEIYYGVQPVSAKG